MNKRQQLMKQAIADLNAWFEHSRIPITAENRNEWQKKDEELKQNSHTSEYWLYRNLKDAGMLMDSVTFHSYLVDTAKDPKSGRALAMKQLLSTIDKGYSYCKACGAALPTQEQLNKGLRR